MKTASVLVALLLLWGAIPAVTATDEYRLDAAWGSESSTLVQFLVPSAVAADGSGNIYVADTDNNRVQKFTSAGTFVTTWGGPGTDPGQFDHPFGIATDAAGNVYVADTRNDRIQAFAPVAAPAVAPIPGGTGVPTDLNGDGKYEDVNGNGRKDFADVVVFFRQTSRIAAHEPVSAFDYNGNGRVDFADVVRLFTTL